MVIIRKTKEEEMHVYLKGTGDGLLLKLSRHMRALFYYIIFVFCVHVLKVCMYVYV